MSMAEMSVVLTGLVLPAVVFVAVVLFALYWIIRKAVRDGIRDAETDVLQMPKAGSADNDQAPVKP